jgi:hypothetical protein
MDRTFSVLPLRFHLVAADSFFFPLGKPGNILRGGFGNAFRAVACFPECQGAQACPVRDRCAYARLFEPRAIDAGPSGLADWPRPFVFRGAHLDGQRLPAGHKFHFDLHLFETSPEVMAFFIATIAFMAGKGFGPRLAHAQLMNVTCIHTRTTVWEKGQQLGVVPDDALVEPLQFDLRPCVGNLSRVRVRFLTPTELTAGGATVTKPDFGALFSRLRDRLSNLSTIYGSGPLDVDFRAMGERATEIRLVKSDIRMIHAERTSGSTHQTHFLGGFVGDAEYEGDLAEFVPFLQAGYWTGVGKKTPWGNGHIQVV